MAEVHKSIGQPEVKDGSANAELLFATCVKEDDDLLMYELAGWESHLQARAKLFGTFYHLSISCHLMRPLHYRVTECYVHDVVYMPRLWKVYKEMSHEQEEKVQHKLAIALRASQSSQDYHPVPGEFVSINLFEIRT